MLGLLRTLSVRYLSRRRVRALLIVASIALGVGTLVATRALSQSMSRAAKSALNPLAGSADLLVVNAQLGIPRAVADDLRRAGIPGLASVHPVVLGRVAVSDLDNRSVWLLGLEMDRSAPTDNPWGIEVKPLPAERRPFWGWVRHTFVTVPTALARGRHPAVVGASLVSDLHLVDKNERTFRVRSGGRQHTIWALASLAVPPDRPAAAVAGNLIIVPVRDASAIVFSGRDDALSRIDLRLEPGANREAVQEAVTRVVGDRARVATPEATDQSLRDVTAGLELGFDLGGAGALVIGLFLVYNALAVSVVERRHEIGILRSLGATRTQIAGLFAGEAGLLGLVGALCGLPLGIFLAYLALDPIQRVLSELFLPLEARQVHVSAGNLLIATLAGMTTALLASLVPALQAAREEVADAVRRVPLLAHTRARILQIVASGGLVLGGLLVVTFRSSLPPRYGVFGGLVLVLVGLLVAAPLAVALINRLLIQPLGKRLFGIETRLASDNLTRSTGRTGLVIGALAAGVALMVQTAGVAESMESAIVGWIDRQLPADLFVTANGPLTAGGQVMAMQEQVASRLLADPDVGPHVEAVVAVRGHPVHYRGRIAALVSFDAQALHDALQSRTRFPELELFPRLATEPDSVLVSENFAALYGVRTGDVLTVPGSNGAVQVRVIGTILDYSWNRGTILMDRKQYLTKFQDPLVDLFHLYLRPGASMEDVRRAATEAGGDESLFVLSRSEVREGIRGLMQRFQAITLSQEVLVGMVAILGVVMALIVSVLHRRRELGLLRAVGATRRQVLHSVLAEATLMGLIGVGVGVVVGLPLEWYALQVLMLDDAGFVFPVQMPWTAAGLVSAGAIVAATLAGLGPAINATRMAIAEAVAYE